MISWKKNHQSKKQRFKKYKRKLKLLLKYRLQFQLSKAYLSLLLKKLLRFLRLSLSRKLPQSYKNQQFQLLKKSQQNHLNKDKRGITRTEIIKISLTEEKVTTEEITTEIEKKVREKNASTSLSLRRRKKNKGKETKAMTLNLQKKSANSGEKKSKACKIKDSQWQASPNPSLKIPTNNKEHTKSSTVKRITTITKLVITDQ